MDSEPFRFRFDPPGGVDPVGPHDLSLEGRVAVVTGAGNGIGAAVATTLARLGADLAVCDRDEAGLARTVQQIEQHGRRSHDAVIDVRERAATDEFVSATEQRFGRVDVLVNNAGGTFFADFAGVSDKGEDMLIAENFTQATRLIRRILPAMPPGSSIVNVTSIEAHQAAPGVAVYAAMKAALANLTASLALELAPRSIRVNAVAPDAVATRGDAQVRDELVATNPAYDPIVVPPLGHLADPMAVAGVVAFLVSDLAGFVTGATLHVDGGNHAAGGWRRTPPSRGRDG